MNNKLLTYYLNELGISEIPSFLIKYLKTPSLTRLKNISYFCGMDFASKDVYNFNEDITRYDHSLSVSLLIYKLTKDKTTTLAGLFHDVATPCFSHVIDYMNKDYEKQESTEEYTEKIMKNDKYLLDCLKKDSINIDDIIDFKKYTIVDNERPKSCADRIDGVILTSIGWTKNINAKDIKSIITNLDIFKNEYNELEIGFKDESIAQKIIENSKIIDTYCHSKEDHYMMELLAKITKLSILKGYIKYEDLYYLNELELINILKNISNVEISVLLYIFRNIKIKDIPNISIPKVKIRKLLPLINGKRYRE